MPHRACLPTQADFPTMMQGTSPCSTIARDLRRSFKLLQVLPVHGDASCPRGLGGGAPLLCEERLCFLATRQPLQLRAAW
jgi:hypothetical protein